MKDLYMLLKLQRFAEGDGAGDGGAGVNAQEAAAPVNPRAKANPMAGAKFGRQPEDDTNGQAAADHAQEAPKRMSFEELLDSDPEYKDAHNKAVQKVLRGRLKDAKGMEDRLGKANELMQLMGDLYGLDVSNPDTIDIDGLTKAVSEDKALYEAAAMREGVPVELYMKSKQIERQQAAMDYQMKRQTEEANARAEMNALLQSAVAFKAANPDFNLDAEMGNPTFARMVLQPPRGVGLSLQDAYYAVHREEIENARRQQQMQMTQQVAAQTAQKVANAVASGSRRPAENGISNPAAAMTFTDPRQLTKEARKELKRQVIVEGKRISWD
jgi:hypothetical protein